MRNLAGYIMMFALTLHFATYAWRPNGRNTRQALYRPAFISKDFTNNKEATVAFNKPLKNDCHKEAIEIHELLKKTGDVGEKVSSGHKKRIK